MFQGVMRPLSAPQGCGTSCRIPPFGAGHVRGGETALPLPPACPWVACSRSRASIREQKVCVVPWEDGSVQGLPEVSPHAWQSGPASPGPARREPTPPLLPQLSPVAESPFHPDSCPAELLLSLG